MGELSSSMTVKDALIFRASFLLFICIYNGQVPPPKFPSSYPFISLFSIVKYKQKSADVFNYDLYLICKWAFNWKTLINPNTNKPAQEVLFSKEKENSKSSKQKP